MIVSSADAVPEEEGGDEDDDEDEGEEGKHCESLGDSTSTSATEKG